MNDISNEELISELRSRSERLGRTHQQQQLALYARDAADRLQSLTQPAKPEKFKGFKRGFCHLSSAWYGETIMHQSDYIDQITIGFYRAEGGTAGEFTITWRKLVGRVTPKLEAWQDSWSVLNQFRDVLDKLDALCGKRPSPEEICKVLVECGVEDMTPRKMSD